MHSGTCTQCIHSQDTHTHTHSPSPIHSLPSLLLPHMLFLYFPFILSPMCRTYTLTSLSFLDTPFHSLPVLSHTKHICTHSHSHMHTHARTCIHPRTHTHTHTHTHNHTNICTHTHMHTHTHTQAHKHMQTHKHVHTHTRFLSIFGGGGGVSRKLG